MQSVLFVCLGNICRSPLGEGILRHLAEERGVAEQLRVDSAGTSAHHVGEPPDRRSVAVAARHGIDLSRQRSRKVVRQDLHDFTLVLAMDRSNFADLARLEADPEAQVSLMMSFAGESYARDVPDPYYGSGDGFQVVYEMLVEACNGVLDSLFPQG